MAPEGAVAEDRSCGVVIVAFATTRHYIRHGRHVVEPWPDYHSRVEYRVTDWLSKNMPDARALPSGTVRFWFDAWHDLNEMSGGSEQGLLNPVVYESLWEINLGTNPDLVLLWLKAMAVDAIYAAGPASEDPFKDVHNTERFSALPLLWDDGQGNRLWSTQRRFAPRVRVVDTAALNAAPAAFNRLDIERLRTYVNVIENGPDSPVTIDRLSTDAMLLHAKFDAGQSLLVQETWDPAWRATVDGNSLPVRKDQVGFMVIDPPPGDRTVRLEFTMPLENRVGWGLTALTLMALAALSLNRRPGGSARR